MLQAIAGHDAKDPTSSHEPVPNYAAALGGDLRGLTVGVPRHYFFSDEANLDPEVAEAVNRAIEALGELGATVRDIEIPSLAHASIANNVIMMSEAHAYHRKNLLSQPENFGDIVRTRFIYGAAYTAADYVQAQRARSRLRREFAAALGGVDLIAATVMPKPAAALKDFDPLGMMLSPSLMAPFNQTGLPTMSVPVGFSSDGLPIGMQIAAAPFREETVLKAGHAYQQHARWHDRRPEL